MNILIRCDSSNIIGSGHIMRCLNLCKYYPKYNFTFVTRDFPYSIYQKIVDEKHKLILLSYDFLPVIDDYKSWIGVSKEKESEELNSVLNKNIFDIVFIDHYGIEQEIEQKIKNNCKKLIVISDIFDYKHDCDVFINYNCDNYEKIKSLLINPFTKIKIGVENIIIHPIFRENINCWNKNSDLNKLNELTINLGGADPKNYILQILENLNHFFIEKKITVNIIIGKSNSNEESIKSFIEKSKYSKYFILYNINYEQMIEVYKKSDLAIGSLSITAYERYFLNIPQICLKIVDNQIIQHLDEFNICKIENLLENIQKYDSLIGKNLNKKMVLNNLFD